MTGSDIRALSAALERGLRAPMELAQREAMIHPRSRLAACLDRLAEGIADIMHDELEHGVDLCADRADDMEDAPAMVAAQTQHDMLREMV